MMKRVISGVFLLIALGALGLILAGALTSGEQLIVRFLTAIIVAALALYVISDLRLQADDSAVASGSRGGPTPSPVRIPAGFGNGHESPPPNSTAAFMATVTGKRSAVPPSVFDKDKTVSGQGPGGYATGVNTDAVPSWAGPSAGPLSSSPGSSGGGGDAATTAGLASGSMATDLDPAMMDAEDRNHPGPTRGAERLPLSTAQSVDVDLDDLLNPYEQDDEEVTRWPLTAEHKAIDVDSLLSPADPALLGSAGGENSGGENSGAATPGDLAEDPEGTTNGAGTADDDAEETFGHGYRQDGVRPVPIGRDHGPVRIDSPFGRLSSGSALGLLDRPMTTSPSQSNDGDRAPGDSALSNTITSPTITSPTIAAAAYARAPMADIVDLRTRRVPVSSEIETAIRNGEIEIIASLMEQGLLSTDGPISDRDVRTMVYVAFTSSELRKILLAGGTLDGDNSDLDLGEVEVFPPTPAAPPAALGTGSTPVSDVIDLRDEEQVSYELDLRSTPTSARAL